MEDCWDTGILIPGVYYDEDVPPVNPARPTKIYYQGARGMDRKVVREIQGGAVHCGIRSRCY
jgi:hypothetical protein